MWIPIYRFRVLKGPVRQDVYNCIQVFLGQNGCEAVELNVQPDLVHLVVVMSPKVSISKLMGVVKGQTSIRVFNRFSYLKKKPYWGNHFWAPGYCVDTVGLDEEMICKYVKHQDKVRVPSGTDGTQVSIAEDCGTLSLPPPGSSLALLWGGGSKATSSERGFLLLQFKVDSYGEELF